MNTMSPFAEGMLTTCGLGHMKPASGTWGSMPPVVIASVIAMGGLTNPVIHGAYCVILVAIFVAYSAACVVWGNDAEMKWKKDPGQVVADETAGQCVTLVMIPTAMVGSMMSLVLTMIGAFLLFRAFDILKPWPAGAMQKIRGGWGILLDDWFAGLMAGIVIWVIHLAM